MVLPTRDMSNALQGSVCHAPKRRAEEQFTGAKLTDIRRVARVKTIAEAMAIHPGRTIPQLCDSLYAVKATYTFLNTRKPHLTIFNRDIAPWCWKQCDSPGSICYWKIRRSCPGRGNMLLRVLAPSATVPPGSGASFTHCPCAGQTPRRTPTSGAQSRCWG